VTPNDGYLDTSGSLARESGVTVATLIKYAQEGLLDFITLPNGTRLFRSGQAAKVREILKQRLANRCHRGDSAVA
jgi:DNA-binding transcriptional MerR regulator